MNTGPLVRPLLQSLYLEVLMLDQSAHHNRVFPLSLVSHMQGYTTSENARSIMVYPVPLFEHGLVMSSKFGSRTTTSQVARIR